jgi:hypothetical protein
MAPPLYAQRSANTQQGSLRYVQFAESCLEAGYSNDHPPAYPACSCHTGHNTHRHITSLAAAVAVLAAA